MLKGYLFLQLIVIIAVARWVGTLFQKLGQPSVIGEMTAGILLGPSFLGLLLPRVEVVQQPLLQFGIHLVCDTVELPAGFVKALRVEFEPGEVNADALTLDVVAGNQERIGPGLERVVGGLRGQRARAELAPRVHEQQLERGDRRAGDAEMRGGECIIAPLVAANGTERVIVLTLKTWYFSINMSLVSDFNFDWGYNLRILDAQGGVIAFNVLIDQFRHRPGEFHPGRPPPEA